MLERREATFSAPAGEQWPQRVERAQQRWNFMALFGDADSKKILGLVDKLERRVQALESEVRVLRDEVQSLRSSAVSSPSSAFPGFPSFGSSSSSASASLASLSSSEPESLDERMRSDPEVDEAVRKKQKIVAIKRVRELTNLGLKEAKDLVERIE